MSLRKENGGFNRGKEHAHPEGKPDPKPFTDTGPGRQAADGTSSHQSATKRGANCHPPQGPQAEAASPSLRAKRGRVERDPPPAPGETCTQQPGQVHKEQLRQSNARGVLELSTAGPEAMICGYNKWLKIFCENRD